jgi:endonuclease YncB( thermonuclease family)
MGHLYSSTLGLALGVLVSACGGSQGTSIHCAASAGMTVLTGKVTAVHDGDTLTLSTADITEQVRLQGMDAPELTQPFGDAARTALSQRTLHQSVRVAYTQRDRYDRLLGQVFTADCSDVNHQMLIMGMAWFYKAYACELESTRRSRYESAETRAHEQHLGLWSQSRPLAPWIFRNGEAAPELQCSD